MSIRCLKLLFALFLSYPLALGAASGPDPIEVLPGDSLWRIYERLPAKNGLNRQAWAVAAQRLNPSAFSVPCSARSLKQGALLQLPATDWVAATSAKQAGLELARQEQATKRGGDFGCSAWFEALTPLAQGGASRPSRQAIIKPADAESGTPEPSPPDLSGGEKAAESATRSTPVEPSGPSVGTAPNSRPAVAAPRVASSAPLPPASEDRPKAADEPTVESGSTPSSPNLGGAAPTPAETETRDLAPASRIPIQTPTVTPLPQLGARSWIGLLVFPLLIWMIWRRFAKARLTGQAGQQAASEPVLYRNRIMWLITLVLVVSQGVYAVYNVNSFQRNYLAAIQAQSQRLGTLLRQDIEYVLKLGIPIEKLVKIETSLAEVLEATPEIEFIEITDLEDRVIYFADHRTMERVEGMDRLSKTHQPLGVAGGLLALSREDTDIRMPISEPRTKKTAGFIQMRIAADLIQGTSHEIVWDIVTVILVSLLISFEFLGFFVSHSFSEPLRRLSRAFALAAPGLPAIALGEKFALPKVGRIIEQANTRMDQVARARETFARRMAYLANRPDAVECEVEQRFERLSLLATKAGHYPFRRGLDRLRGKWQDWLKQIGQMRNTVAASPAPMAIAASTKELTPHRFIRPFVFLYFVAYNLPVSFFPLYVRTLYEPLWGLPQEVLIGLPISVFMLFFALSMLLVGGWLDRAGWYRPLLFGAAIFCLGFAMTALADSYAELILYRAITGVGLGIGFMGFQQFVIENTSNEERSVGLASFIGAFFAGEITGTVVGGMLADRLGYANVFLLSSGVAAASMLGMVFFFGSRIQTPEHAPRKQPAIPLATMFSALRDREFLAVVLFQAIPAKVALVGFLMYFVPLYLSEVGTSQSDIGRIAMSYALMLIFFGPLVSRWFGSARHRRYMVLTGGLITGIAMLSFHWVDDSLAVLLLVMALGIAHTFSLSSQASLIAETSLVKRLGMGTGMGTYRFWERVGNIMGPFAMATLVAVGGYQQAVVWLGAGTVLSSILYLIAMPAYTQDGGAGETAPAQLVE